VDPNIPPPLIWMDVLFVADRRNLCWILPPDSFRFARPNEPLARFSKQIQILQACEHYTYSNVIRTLYFSKKTEILFVIWGATVFRAPMFFVIFFNGKRKHIEMQWANERCLNSSPVELKTQSLSIQISLPICCTHSLSGFPGNLGSKVLSAENSSPTANLVHLTVDLMDKIYKSEIWK